MVYIRKSTSHHPKYPKNKKGIFMLCESKRHGDTVKQIYVAYLGTTMPNLVKLTKILKKKGIEENATELIRKYKTSKRRKL